jgi:phosphoribosylanthranilate isomerase
VKELAAACGAPVIKAFRVRDVSDLEAAAAYSGAAEMPLFDAKAPEALHGALPGGNGLSFDWTLLGGRAGTGPFMLSGGLNAGNVGEAIRVTGAPIVDVSSGVERAPGAKDPELIRKFIEAVRSVG